MHRRKRIAFGLACLLMSNTFPLFATTNTSLKHFSRTEDLATQLSSYTTEQALIVGNQDEKISQVTQIVADNPREINKILTYSTNVSWQEGDIKSLLDSDVTTKWKGNFTTTGERINISSIDLSEKEDNFNISKIILLVTPETYSHLQSAKVEVNANGQGYMQEIVPEGQLTWSEEGGYKRAEILVPRVIAQQFSIVLKGTGEIEFADIRVEGEFLTNNEGQYVQISKNGVNLTDLEKQNLIDGKLNTEYAVINNNDIFEFNFEPYRINTNSFQFASNFPNNQGIASGTLEYWDGLQWQTIESNKQFTYEHNSQARALGGFTYERVLASKLRFKVLNTNKTWGKFIMQEVFIGGVLETKAEDIAKTITKESIPLQVPKEGIFKMPELSDKLKGLYDVSIQSSSHLEVLNTNGIIVTPTVDTYVDVIFRVTNKSNPQDFADTVSMSVMIPADLGGLGGILAKSSQIVNGQSAYLTDGNKLSHVVLGENGTIILGTEKVGNKNVNFKNDNISIWVTPETYSKINGIAIYQYYPNAYVEVDNITNIAWVDDGGLKRADLTLSVPTASSEYKLIFSTIGSIEIGEVIVRGQKFAYDLSEFATVTKNGVSQGTNGIKLYDTDLNTPYESIAVGDQLVFDFAPYEFELSSLYFTMNFPKSQTVSSGKLEYWDGSKWIELGNKNLNWQTNNQIREIRGFEFNKIRSSKMRFTTTGVNQVWGPKIMEVFLNGTRVITAEGVASKIVNMPTQQRDATSLTLPTLSQLPNEFANDFEVSFYSSDNTGVVTSTGAIIPPALDTSVNVALKVTKLSTKEEAYTVPLLVKIPQKTPENYRNLKPVEDQTSFIKNPNMGWVVYLEYSCELHDEWTTHVNQGGSGTTIEQYACIDADHPDQFFAKLDQEIAKGLKPSILYMRMGWQWYEPKENEYAWRNPNSMMSQYIQGAKDRGLQIAFRVLVSDDYNPLDKTDNDPKQTVPGWLYKKQGIQTYMNNEGSKTPYYDNEVYLTHYEDLIRELGKDFNDPNLVAFMDAQGLGTWGEMHDVRTSGRLSLKQTLERHAAIWNTYFDKVLLGATFGGGVDSINQDSIVPNYKHMVRRDAFGSKWLGSFTNNYLQNFFSKKIPMYGEVAYWHLKKPGYVEQYFPADAGIGVADVRTYLQYAIKQAQECRANTLDARVPSDWSEWTEKGLDLINKFTIENGYRLVPTEFIYPREVTKGQEVQILHSWKNTALGFLPTANNQLKDKYKISFALLNDRNEVAYQYVDKTIDPSWIKEDGIVAQNTRMIFPTNLPMGNYKLAVSIVDTAENRNQPGINLAVSSMERIDTHPTTQDPKTWYGGWYVIDQIIVK